MRYAAKRSVSDISALLYGVLELTKLEALMAKLGDYDRWFKPCANCGHDSGRKSDEFEARCWKCGRKIDRDYSDRALKKNRAI